MLFLVGPTAVGKTQVACELMRRLNAEIVSCDSMQVYRGMPVLSQSPSPQILKKFPHHLVGHVSPSRTYDAARFVKEAKRAIHKICQRGRIPILVGGSGLYVKSLVDGLFEGPGRDDKVRKKLVGLSLRYGKKYLYSRLCRIDPQAAGRIHPNDLRRIVRALEVYELSKMPISQWRVQTQGIASDYNIVMVGLTQERSWLYKRIERRVHEMFRRGLEREVKNLLNRRLSLSAGKILGFKEVQGTLSGDYSRREARQRLKKNTRRFAKRQISWFKRDHRIKWFERIPKERTETLAKKILFWLKTSGVPMGEARR